MSQDSPYNILESSSFHVDDELICTMQRFGYGMTSTHFVDGKPVQVNIYHTVDTTELDAMRQYAIRRSYECNVLLHLHAYNIPCDADDGLHERYPDDSKDERK